MYVCMYVWCEYTCINASLYIIMYILTYICVFVCMRFCMIITWCPVSVCGALHTAMRSTTSHTRYYPATLTCKHHFPLKTSPVSWEVRIGSILARQPNLRYRGIKDMTHSYWIGKDNKLSALSTYVASWIYSTIYSYTYYIHTHFQPLVYSHTQAHTVYILAESCIHTHILYIYTYIYSTYIDMTC